MRFKITAKAFNNYVLKPQLKPPKFFLAIVVFMKCGYRFFFFFFFLAKSQLPALNHNFLLNQNSKPNSHSHKQILKLNHKSQLPAQNHKFPTKNCQNIFYITKIYKKDFLHSKLPSNSHSQQAATSLPNCPQKLQEFALLKHTQKEQTLVAKYTKT